VLPLGSRRFNGLRYGSRADWFAISGNGYSSSSQLRQPPLSAGEPRKSQNCYVFLAVNIILSAFDLTLFNEMRGEL
jgi:hypothetical protein